MVRNKEETLMRWWEHIRVWKQEQGIKSSMKKNRCRNDRGTGLRTSPELNGLARLSNVQNPSLSALDMFETLEYRGLIQPINTSEPIRPFVFPIFVGLLPPNTTHPSLSYVLSCLLIGWMPLVTRGVLTKETKQTFQYIAYGEGGASIG